MQGLVEREKDPKCHLKPVYFAIVFAPKKIVKGLGRASHNLCAMCFAVVTH